MDTIWKELFDAAKAVQHERRISEYVTGGEVAAAILSRSGKIYTGVCIDTCSTLGICAERNAIFHAVAEGHTRDMVRIVIAGRSEDFCVPCGICRQVMQEFAPNLTVICLNGKGEAKTFALKELLPYGFDNTWLPEGT